MDAITLNDVFTIASTVAGVAVAAGVPGVLAVVWVVRLEGRVNTLASELKGLKDDVHYIRNRIDRAIGVVE